jgi:hypothetical protein
LQNFTADQLAGAVALSLGALGPLLLVTSARNPQIASGRGSFRVRAFKKTQMTVYRIFTTDKTGRRFNYWH